MHTESTQEQLFTRIQQEGIGPNAEKIARIMAAGDIPILFFEVGEIDPEHASMVPDSEAAARSFGWNGQRVQLGIMTRKQAKRFAESLQRTCPSDGAVAWLREVNTPRLFLFAHVGTVCLNLVKDAGFVVAPGTADADWLS